jgi:chemotaxis protein CheX
MDERDLRIFVEGAMGWFRQFDAPAEVETPYLTDSPQRELHAFTGIIGVAGGWRGCVYYTAPEVQLREMLVALGEPARTPEVLSDLCGEIANTIAGNVRRELGPGFLISVPVVVRGAPADLRVAAGLHSFVIPLVWRRARSAVVVSIGERGAGDGDRIRA